MKQHKILSLLAVLCTLFFASCVDYEDPALYTPTVTTGSAEAASITRTEGIITATIISPDIKTIKKAGFRYSQYETMEVATEVKSTIEGQNIKASLSNLETGKTYYYYAFASGGFNEVRGQVQSFTTKQYDAPTLSKVSITDIGESSLNASASLIDNGGDALNAAGFIYRAYPMSEPDPVPSLTSEEWQFVSHRDFASISNGSAFTELIENLEPNTEYALSAFATNKASLTGYSEVVRFRTEEHADVPTVELVTLVSVDETEMQLASSVIATGGKEVTERGFCYSTSSLLPTTEDTFVKATGNDEQFQTLVSGLTPGQKYYVRAYAINEKGTGYSSAALDVTTPKYDVPVLSVTTMTNIVENSALATAYINSTGNTNITECGFCISESNKEPGKNDRVVYVNTASSHASSMESAPDYKHVASNAKASYLLAESKETTPTKARTSATADDTNNQISATISDLTRGTKYYIRAFATNLKGTSYGSVAEFQTADYRTVPTVALAVLESVDETLMNLSSSVSNNGGDAVTERGFCYSATKSTPTIDDTKCVATGNDAGFQQQITGLIPGQKYYVRAYATNTKGTGYSSAAIEVTTPKYDVPTVSATTMTNVVENSATATAYISSTGNAEITERGFCISESNNTPGMSDRVIYAGGNTQSRTSQKLNMQNGGNGFDYRAMNATRKTASYNVAKAGSRQQPQSQPQRAKAAETDNEITALIDNLERGKTYYIRAFATNLKGTSYGSVAEFQTADYRTVPTVALAVLESVDETLMNLSSSVSNNGGDAVTEHGFCYSTSKSTPTIDDTKCVATGDDTGFQQQVTGLTPGQKYYVRAYATNTKGTGYSSAAIEVTTPKYDVPTVSATTMTNIVETSASATAYISSTGNAEITERGFCISESNNTPGMSDRVIYAGSNVQSRASQKPNMQNAVNGYDYRAMNATRKTANYNVAKAGSRQQPLSQPQRAKAAETDNEITALIDNLERGKTYYIRAFATNLKGTSYGSVAEFQTADYRTVPSVGMAVLESVTETSMDLSSSVSNNGGSTVTERGFCYSTSKTTPTLEDTHSAATGSDTNFKHQFTDLAASQKYYVRAYATNEKGTGYSDAAIEVTTITPEFFLATIGEITMSEVKEVSAIATASITDKGNTSVVLSGFCMSQTNTLPDLDDLVIFSTSNSDATISATITGLEKNNTYYLRAFVTNTVGTAFSSTKEFQTANYVAPTVDAVVLENVDYTEMTVSSSISYNGGIDVTERGFCYSRTNNMPTLADSYIEATGSDASFQATITKLWSGQTYYVRAYAKNERGTSYSHSALEVNTPSNGYDPFNGHDYVDLGLKDADGNTIYWATCNVGAENPEDYGDYFAWGETEPYYQAGHSQDNPCESWKTGKTGYDWASYKWCNGSYNTLTKYCNKSSYGNVDNKTVLEPADDAATQNWGGNWRMPTKAEQDQLRTSCTWTWNSTKKGYTVKGTNGNSIFLPAAGFRYDSRLNSAGSYGYYWSSSLGISYSHYAYYLYFSSNFWNTDYSSRDYGRSVRAVCVSIE